MPYKVDIDNPQRGPLTTRPGSDQLYLTMYYPVHVCPPPELVSGIQPSVASKKRALPRAHPMTSGSQLKPDLPPPNSQFEVTQEEVSMVENMHPSTPFVHPQRPLPMRLLAQPSMMGPRESRLKPVMHSTPINGCEDSTVVAGLLPFAPSPIARRSLDEFKRSLSKRSLDESKLSLNDPKRSLDDPNLLLDDPTLSLAQTSPNKYKRTKL